MRRELTAAAAAALLVAACATTKTASIGATLRSGSLSVRVDRYDAHPPMPAGDLTGLSRPAPGHRLVAAHVHLCTNIGPAIGTWDFSLGLDGGAQATVNNVETNYPQRFGSVSSGCSTGWVVFQIPRASDPGSVRFKFDDTGNAASAYPTRGETHVRFSWTIA